MTAVTKTEVRLLSTELQSEDLALEKAKDVKNSEKDPVKEKVEEVAKSLESVNLEKDKDLKTVTYDSKFSYYQMIGKTRLIVVQGDLLAQKVDAIVNAANEQLEQGMGVCGRIFSAAGERQLELLCDKVPTCGEVTKMDSPFGRAGPVRCPVGQARATESCKLSDRGIKVIIHAVGPMYNLEEKDTSKTLLASAYQASLKALEQYKSIAFPALSTGIFGYPKEEAAAVAFKAIKEWVEENSDKVEQVRLVYWGDEDFQTAMKSMVSVGFEPKMDK